MTDFRDSEALNAIEQLVAQIQIIAAIKELRSPTGWGLAESKDAIDEYRARGAWPPSLFAEAALALSRVSRR